MSCPSPLSQGRSEEQNPWDRCGAAFCLFPVVLVGFPHHQLEMHPTGSLCWGMLQHPHPMELILGMGTGCHSRAGLSPPSSWLGILVEKETPGEEMTFVAAVCTQECH